MTAPATASANSRARERYEAVIGIEVHCQLRTVSKMFCACSTAYDGAAPNTHVCPVCLGLPGALPVINRRAVEHVLATGLAIEASTPDATRWDRKNYFYPDLPKGYQISQYDLPLASAGRLTVDTSDGPFTIGITRAHLEEDTAKLVHATDADGRKVSLVDFNRSGAPLMEIVTDPDIRTAEQARRYAEELQLLLRTDRRVRRRHGAGPDAGRGERLAPPRGTEPFGTRVEVKNMNSFRSVERAIEFEIDRQAAALDAGEPLLQETRGWSDDRGETYRMRSRRRRTTTATSRSPTCRRSTSSGLAGRAASASCRSCPAARRARYRETFGLERVRRVVLVADPDATALFEATLAAGPVARPQVGRELGHRGVPASAQGGPADEPVSVEPAELAVMIAAVDEGTLSRANAKEVLEVHAATGQSTASIVAARGFRQISDAGALGDAVDAGHSPRTRRRSRTTGPARPRPSASSSARS